MWGQYGCMQGPMWVHVRADMGSHERAVMGFGIMSSINSGNYF